MITNQQILEEKKRLNEFIEVQWIEQIFLSPSWIFQMFIIIITYAVFFYLVDKKRITEILLYGSLVAVSFSVYDSIAEHLNYWITLQHVLPFHPNFFLGNITIIPLSAMLVHQYTLSWKNYLIAITVWAGLLAFIYYGLVLDYLKIFIYLKKFASIIDFLLFIIVGIIVRWLVSFLKHLEGRSS